MIYSDSWTTATYERAQILKEILKRNFEVCEQKKDINGTDAE
jgi:hypothetical protein